MNRLLIIGHDESEYQAIRERVPDPVVYFEMLPRLQLIRGGLHVEHPNAHGRFLPVSRVIFHGIFENDLPALAALALWGGPCYPRARGMMDCRLRIPCLVRALSATRFGAAPRGYADHETVFSSESETVAKWGEWHCGENKARFNGTWTAVEPTLFEPFIEGEAVRVQLIGDRAWQYQLGGDDWKKSIHHPNASVTATDSELLEDARRLQAYFGLEILGVDYMVSRDGNKHLLEVNHIPSVTAFAEVREAYIEHVVDWLKARSSGAIQ